MEIINYSAKEFDDIKQLRTQLNEYQYKLSKDKMQHRFSHPVHEDKIMTLLEKTINLNTLNLKQDKYIKVLQENNKNIGFIQYGKAKSSFGDPYVYIYAIYIDKTYRQHNWGEKLYNFAKEFAQEEKLDIMLDCIITNLSVKFFEKHGFKPYLITYLKEHKEK